MDPKILPELQLPTKPFIFNKTVYLPDTNAEGNVYFSRYFDWQGQTREAYLKAGITKEEYFGMIKARVRLVTVKASMEFYRMAWLFDEITVKMTTRNIRHASLEMVFLFVNQATNEILGQGVQQLAFQDRKGRLIAIPSFIRRIATAIEAPSKDPKETE